MFTIKEITNEDLRAVIRNTAAKLGRNEVVIEKDFWMTFVMNYLFGQSDWKAILTFKGGTSLSKCFNLINRFSEDIDLILDWTVLGYSREEPWFARSKTKQDLFNKEVNQRTQMFLKNKFVPKMTKDFSKLLSDDFRIGIDVHDSQTVLFEYPTHFQSSYVRPSIRLEIGPLAAWTPSEWILIKSDVQFLYPTLFEGEGIAVRTVLPERTFWEKVTILHHEANRPRNSKMPARYARHYYDIYCFAHSIYKDRAIIQASLLQKVVDFKKKFYPRSWANYEQATMENIRLLPESWRLPEIEKDYHDMKEMFFGDFPDFTNLIKTISNLEREIHDCKGYAIQKLSD